MKFYDMLQCNALTLKTMIKEQNNLNEKKKLKIAFVTKNILCILFCMIVVIMFSKIFGQQNSIVGVVTLIALLLFRCVDLGVNKISGSINLFVIFVIYAFIPYITNIVNPWIAFLIDLIFIMILLILTCHNLLMGNQSTVILSYLLLQGYDITPQQFPSRIISLLFGGILVSIVYYIKHSKKTYRRNLKDLFLEFRLSSFRGRWQIKVTLSIAILLLCGRLLSLDRIMWLGFACLSVMHPDSKQMYTRLKHRPIFVFVGSILFILGFYIFPASLFEQIGIIGGIMVGFSGSYQWQTVFNCFGGLSSAIQVVGLPLAIILRIVYNVVASIYAVVFSRFFDLFVNKITNKRQVKN